MILNTIYTVQKCGSSINVMYISHEIPYTIIIIARVLSFSSFRVMASYRLVIKATNHARHFSSNVVFDPLLVI